MALKSEGEPLNHLPPPRERGMRGDREGASNPLSVVLTSDELKVAALVGTMRRIDDLSRSYKTRNQQPTERLWADNIEGAAAEMALAKLLNKYFPSRFRQTDVGDLEVRVTSHEDGCLIVRHNDSDAKRYVLVVGQAPRFKVIGYIWGNEAKKPEYWRAPNGRPGAYFVPQSALKPL